MFLLRRAAVLSNSSWSINFDSCLTRLFFGLSLSSYSSGCSLQGDSSVSPQFIFLLVCMLLAKWFWWTVSIVSFLVRKSENIASIPISNATRVFPFFFKVDLTSLPLLELCRIWPAVTPPTLLELCRSWHPQWHPSITWVVTPWVQSPIRPAASVHCMHIQIFNKVALS